MSHRTNLIGEIKAGIRTSNRNGTEWAVVYSAERGEFWALCSMPAPPGCTHVGRIVSDGISAQYSYKNLRGIEAVDAALRDLADAGRLHNPAWS